MRIPTVHANGDSKATLFSDNVAAHDAISRAIEIVLKTAPNGRNFYMQGVGAIGEAMEQHFRRIHSLKAVRQEFEKIIFGIEEQ
jgi:hypothetical protein